MSIRFRRTLKLFPGVLLNISKSGVSASFGSAPLTFNVGSRGAFSTVSVPGSGLSIRERLIPLDRECRAFVGVCVVTAGLYLVVRSIRRQRDR